MGAWHFVDRRIEKVLSRLDMKVRRPVYVGVTPRPARRPAWPRPTWRNRHVW